MRWEPRYSESQVREAVENARSLTEAIRLLGLRSAGGNFKSMRKLIAHYGISTDHFDPNWAKRGPMPHRAMIPLDEVLVVGSTYSRWKLKRRLYSEGLKHRRCELCGQNEDWHGKHMSLILDHINGDPTDNRLENLRIVCPNCAATLETHCGRKNRRKPRACLRCGREFLPSTPTTATALTSAGRALSVGIAKLCAPPTNSSEQTSSR